MARLRYFRKAYRTRNAWAIVKLSSPVRKWPLTIEYSSSNSLTRKSTRDRLPNNLVLGLQVDVASCVDTCVDTKMVDISRLNAKTISNKYAYRSVLHDLDLAIL